MSHPCPNCHQTKFELQDLVIKFPETLDQWEHETATRFRPETRADYAEIKQSVFYKCAACEFGSFLPAAAGTANFYRDITTEGDYYVFEKWEFKKTFRFINSHKITAVLDYGCGGGAFLKQLKSKFPKLRLAGFDMNPNAAEIFKDTGIDFSNNMESDTRSYDLVTAFQIIEHLEDPFTALKVIKQRIQTGGYLVISVPNAKGPIRHFPYALTEVPPHHVNRWTANSMKTYLEAEGFEVVETAFEPLSRTLWPYYLPVMVKKLFPDVLQAAYTKLRLHKVVSLLIKLLNVTPLKTIPVKGHSVYVVARKCAE